MYLLTPFKIHPDATLLEPQRGVINYFDLKLGQGYWIREFTTLGIFLKPAKRSGRSIYQVVSTLSAPTEYSRQHS